jgi:hypothetical protein
VTLLVSFWLLIRNAMMLHVHLSPWFSPSPQKSTLHQTQGALMEAAGIEPESDSPQRIAAQRFAESAISPVSIFTALSWPKWA